MTDLRQELTGWIQGRVALVGLGNVDLGDDGVGMQLLDRLAGLVQAADTGAVTLTGIAAGTRLERRLHELAGGRFDRVLFMDAAELGAEPGSVALLERSALRACLPQVSTHRLSLSLAADLIEAEPPTRVALLAVQPGSMGHGQGLSRAVQGTVELLLGWLADAAARGAGSGESAVVIRSEAVEVAG
jgi:hydrogenase maturation protease